MEKKLTATAIALALLAASLPEPAQSQGVLPETVVTASRLPTPRERVASSVTVVTAEDIAAKQQRTLVEVLGDVPGLQVVQSGGLGKQTSVFSRGSNSNHTLIVIDGVEMSDTSTPNGAFNFAHLLTADIERIEVVRGPQSTLFGSDAIGAVISITTKLGTGPTQYLIQGEGGAFDTVNGTLQVAGSRGRLRYALGSSYLDSDGESVSPARIRALQAGATEEDDGYTQRSASVRLAYEASDSVNFGFALHHVRTRSETDQPIEDPDAYERTRQWFGRADATLDFFGGLMESIVGASVTRHTRDSFNVPGIANTLQRSDDLGAKTKYEIQNNFFVVEDHILTLGLETELDSLKNTQFSNFSGFTIVGTTDSDARTNAAYVQDQFAYGNRVFGTLGFRYDDHDTLGSKLTFRLAPVVAFPERGLRIKAAVGTGFRAPALFQLFGNTRSSNGGTFRGDPNLRAEESIGWEVGFEQSVMTGRVTVGSTYFDQEIKNLLETKFTGSNSTVINLARADIFGFESFISAGVTPNVSVRLDHTFTRAENKATGGDLRRRPKQKLSAEVRYHASDRLSVIGGMRFNGPGKDVSGNPLASSQEINKGSHTLVNVSANYDLNDGASLFGRINNLLNRKYETADGLAGSSRAVVVGARVRF